MHSLVSKNIERLEYQIAQELRRLPKSDDPYDTCVNLWDMALSEFNLDIKAIFKGHGDEEPFFYTGLEFDGEGFDLSETQEILQEKGFTFEEIKYFLERVLETIKEQFEESSSSEDLPF